MIALLMWHILSQLLRQDHIKVFCASLHNIVNSGQLGLILLAHLVCKVVVLAVC